MGSETFRHLLSLTTTKSHGQNYCSITNNHQTSHLFWRDGCCYIYIACCYIYLAIRDHPVLASRPPPPVLRFSSRCMRSTNSVITSCICKYGATWKSKYDFQTSERIRACRFVYRRCIYSHSRPSCRCIFPNRRQNVALSPIIRDDGPHYKCNRI